MQELDNAISEAFKNPANQEIINHAYLVFLRNIFLVPIKKGSKADGEFVPLSTMLEDRYFMVAFDEMDRLQQWAGVHLDDIDYVELSGSEIVAGLHSTVYLSINIGTSFAKEFSPDEIKRLKTIVIRMAQLHKKV